MAERVVITTYRPLVLGILPGKYQVGAPMPSRSRGQTDVRIPAWLHKYGESVRWFNRLAADRGIHPAQLAIASVCHSPAVTAPSSPSCAER